MMLIASSVSIKLNVCVGVLKCGVCHNFGIELEHVSETALELAHESLAEISLQTALSQWNTKFCRWSDRLL